MDWQTSSETNCKLFEVELSTDGKNWQSIGSTESKANNGSSSTALSYNLTFDTKGIVLGTLGLSLILLAFPRRNRYSIIICFALAIAALNACTKDNRSVISEADKVFVRIAQYDIDDTVNYSKTVQAIKE